MAKKRNDINFQFRLFNWLMYAFVLLIFSRLVQVQVINRNEYLKSSTAQNPVYHDIQPQRGRIFDRNYDILAFNVPAVKIVANCDSIKTPYDVAYKLAPIVNIDANSLLDKLKNGKGWIELTKAVPEEVGAKVNALERKFVASRPTVQRYYPKGTTACQVVGFTRVDGRGVSGIESIQDSLLLGKAGMAVYQKTGRERLLPHPRQSMIPAEDGTDVVLTLHSEYQKIVEEELAATVEASNAHSGIAVVMEPATGDILAISSVPLFNPNRYTEYDEGARKLRAITDQFEPGSTFKVAAMAAMLDANFVNPDQVVFCENGTYKAWDRTIRDTKAHGDLTAHDIVVNSSNIGMAKLAKDFDPNVFYNYLKALGFGDKCNIGLPGETGGTLRNANEWYPIDNMSMAYGYGLNVSGLQMASLFATIANKGVRAQPRLIHEFHKNNESYDYQKNRSFKRVLREETAATITDMLADVVDHGTGTNAQIPGINICGKTGTAHIARSDARGYSDRYFSSFGGFFPKKDPKLVIFIMIRDPRGAYYGGSVAAPCFKKIAERIIHYEGENYFVPNQSLQMAHETKPIVPNLIGFKKNKAVNVLHNIDLSVRFTNQGDWVSAQEPEPGAEMPADGLVYLTMQQTEFTQQERVVPQVVGLPLRNALNVLAANELSALLQGSGQVVQQHPAAGEPITPGSKVTLICKAAI